MENTPPQPAQQAIPQQPVPQAAQGGVAQPALAPTPPAPQPIPPPSPVPPPAPATNIGAATPPTASPSPVKAPVPPNQTQKPPLSAALPKDQAKSSKKFILGCVGAFGCSLILFIGVIFAFIFFGSTDNPIFGFLGVPPGEVINVLITLINFIFLFLVFITFIFVIIGIFKRTTAKKEDTEAKRKAAIFIFLSVAALIFFVIVWIAAYFFLAPKRTTTVKASPIMTEPAVTTNLTAPVTVKFDATKVPINKQQYDILNYSWDFGDGDEAKGVKQTHTYSDLGNFKVVLKVTVKEKATGKEQDVEFPRDVTIQNVLAKVVIKATPEKGVAPLKVKLDGSASSSPNGEITEFAWDLDEDGEFDDSSEAEAETMLEKIGSYTIKLRVIDSTGTPAIGEQTIEATVPDTPQAVITVEGVEGSQLILNTPYVFNASASTSPTGIVEKYDWSFGDGGKSSTRTATHTFKEPGQYEVILRVTDSEKKTGEGQARYTVSAAAGAPLASLKTTPAAVDNVVTGQAPFDVIFNASGSTDLNGNIVEYSWDFDGDGKTDEANATVTHTFPTPGNYTVQLTITDSTNLSTSANVVVRVEAQGLRAKIKAEPVAGPVPLTVNFDASGSSYSDGDIVSFEWEFGDGGKPRIDAAQVSHQYTAIGTFTARVTAITSDNKRASAQMAINVRPVSLTSCFEASAEQGLAPLAVEFDPTCSTGTVVKYRWNFANLGRSVERKPSFVFKDPGEYSVSLEVADSENVVNTFTKKITVTAPDE